MKGSRIGSLELLKEWHAKCVSKYSNEEGFKVSDVYESTISHSFRVYYQGMTVVFYQYRKDEET